MKYNFIFFALCVSHSATFFCPIQQAQRPLIPNPPPRFHHVIRQRPQQATQPKTTIFNAGIVQQKPKGVFITFTDYPEIILTCNNETIYNEITFQACEDCRSIPIIINETNTQYELRDHDAAYLQEPSITLEQSPNHPINPPRLISSSCVFQWPGQNARHIFFVYKKENNACVEYIYEADNANPSADYQT